MPEVLYAFRDFFADHRGAFTGRVVGHQAADGTWEGRLEFAPTTADARLLVTHVESRQQTHEQLLHWASGLTTVYAEGALHRAYAAAPPEAPRGPSPDPPAPAGDLKERRRRLRDLIAALDRRVPQFDRDGEVGIVRDAAILKRQAQDRLAKLK